MGDEIQRDTEQETKIAMEKKETVGKQTERASNRRRNSIITLNAAFLTLRAIHIPADIVPQPPPLRITPATAHCLRPSALDCAHRTQIWRRACAHFQMAQAARPSRTSLPAGTAGCVAPVAMEANSQAENPHCVHSMEALRQNIRTHVCRQTTHMQPSNGTEHSGCCTQRGTRERMQRLSASFGSSHRIGHITLTEIRVFA